MFRHLLSFTISALLVKAILPFKKHIGQPISKFLPSHANKSGTPTLGGVAVYISFILCRFNYMIRPELLWIYGVGTACFLVGLLDDIVKIKTGDNRGLNKLTKLILLIPLLSACLLYGIKYTNYLLFALHLILIILFASAFDIIDGLDGLLGLISVPILITISILFPSTYVICNILSGSILGFLIFNLNPARIFMGDSGSMLIGGIIGALFIKCNLDLRFFALCSVPAIDTTSVGIAMAFQFLGIKSKRYIAPIHHELEARFGERNTVLALISTNIIICTVLMLANWAYSFII
jgi:phospho-N-acetylmuramoyl-pentapeptide-transferase